SKVDAIDDIYSHAINKNVKGPKSNTNNCSCVIHQVFGGILQSTVVCSECGNVTVSNDPVLDLSLEIQPQSYHTNSVQNNLLSALQSKEESNAFSNHGFSKSGNSTGNGGQSDNSTLDPIKKYFSDKEIYKKISIIDFELRKQMAYRENGDSINKSDSEMDASSVNSTGTNTPEPFAKQSQTNGNIAHVQTLQKCLDQFTHPEILSSGVYTCSNCESSKVRATKQFAIKQLPPVLSFQLKRFNRGLNSSSKLNTYVRLPLTLDMTPYTTNNLGPNTFTPGSQSNQSFFSEGTPLSTYSALSTSNLGTKTQGGHNDSTSLGTSSSLSGTSSVNPACQYQLFAVINHTGALDTGHYTLYSLHRNQWFKFDDSSITFADISDVLGLKEEAKALRGEPSRGLAYMAFYVKHTLDFNDPPGLVPETLQSSGQTIPVPTLQPDASGQNTSTVGATGSNNLGNVVSQNESPTNNGIKKNSGDTPVPGQKRGDKKVRKRPTTQTIKIPKLEFIKSSSQTQANTNIIHEFGLDNNSETESDEELEKLIFGVNGSDVTKNGSPNLQNELKDNKEPQNKNIGDKKPSSTETKIFGGDENNKTEINAKSSSSDEESAAIDALFSNPDIDDDDEE
ncbi:hypothetical protein BB558_006866, partial [Smittium angustum]